MTVSMYWFDDVPGDEEIIEQQIENIVHQHLFGFALSPRLPRDVWMELQQDIEQHQHSQLKWRLQELKRKRRLLGE